MEAHAEEQTCRVHVINDSIKNEVKCMNCSKRFWQKKPREYEEGDSLW